MRLLGACEYAVITVSQPSLPPFPPSPRPSPSTKLFYMVNVKPKGPVPVGALEWRIKEDVPTNLRAVKVASEKLPWECEQDQAALAGRFYPFLAPFLPPYLHFFMFFVSVHTLPPREPCLGWCHVEDTGMFMDW